MKTAVVHDWLVSLGGAERVLEAILDIFPSPLFTLLKSESFKKLTPIKTSFIQKLPFASQVYRNYLPFFPWAIERFDLKDYDLVISSSHAVAKGVQIQERQLHICYCHTPMRYAWDLYDQYMSQMKGFKAHLAKRVLRYLRNWDLKTVHRVDYFVANSNFVADRIQRIYGCPAVVIYPPVNTHLFHATVKKDHFYLTVSRLVPYKRIDLIVEAFTKTPSKQLIVIGDGPELEKMRKRAGKNIEFLGFQPDEVVRDYLARAIAFIFAAEEDFGIVPVEAQAAGTPVIAYGKGGALETIIEGETGLFFKEQTSHSLQEAIDRFQKKEWDYSRICTHSKQFGVERFKTEFKRFVESKWETFCEDHHLSRR